MLGIFGIFNKRLYCVVLSYQTLEYNKFILLQDGCLMNYSVYHRNLLPLLIATILQILPVDWQYNKCIQQGRKAQFDFPLITLAYRAPY